MSVANLFIFLVDELWIFDCLLVDHIAEILAVFG